MLTTVVDRPEGAVMSDSTERLPAEMGHGMTDDDALRALRGRGIGSVVNRPDDPEAADRATAAGFVLASPDQVKRFLHTLGVLTAPDALMGAPWMTSHSPTTTSTLTPRASGRH
ncbi:hypothetical protein ABZV31_11955 [Streptomyces sp. NPDC005202]|uniref:hypothetical protein n=1 Tax=Streptomyces sp. NPDC005202 TaxID=3157021 RepID=UPI0033B383D6